GIFVCGSAVGPQVIPDCVAQASAAASRAQFFLTGHRIEMEERSVEPLDLAGPTRVGVIVCKCGINIAGLLDVEELAEYAASLPSVVGTKTDLFLCSSTGQDELIEMVHEHRLNRVVVAACTPRTHESVFREALASIGFNPYLLEMVNIRDQCSWVHANEQEAARKKARTLIRMGVARAHHLQPLTEGSAPMTRAALVIGGGIAGIQAATDLAECGLKVTLVEQTERLGGRLASPNLKYLYPNQRPAHEVLQAKIDRLNSSGANVMLNAEVDSISGFVGNFEVNLKGESEQILPVGAIILATGADLYDPRGEYGFGKLANVITSEELERVFCEDELALSFGWPASASFVLCVGSRD
ncbi:MAG: CoB--CoM heterodisulfide reductase iron-sulfur subunit A family protein, partial [bacterium]|nr:CoB--CoM heterodisulfide reductase iron-sulfur subunit A family protein [bacterium]